MWTRTTNSQLAGCRLNCEQSSSNAKESQIQALKLVKEQQNFFLMKAQTEKANQKQSSSIPVDNYMQVKAQYATSWVTTRYSLKGGRLYTGYKL